MGKELDSLKELLKIQGYNGNWDNSEYMWGMYNGLELAVATLEDRDPVFKERPKKFASDPDEEKDRRESLVRRLHSGWGKR